jgi:hypothetical protein
MPVQNARPYLEEGVESILAQTFPDLEQGSGSDPRG